MADHSPPSPQTQLLHTQPFQARPFQAQRVFLSEQPFDPPHVDWWMQRGVWPARWIWHPDAKEAPCVCAFRLRFSLSEAKTLRLHVSADERYELFLDGELIGRGPERGDPENWFFESYDVSLEAGEHRLVARVWTLGTKAPFAQMSLRPGFLLGPDDTSLQSLLGTGDAPWETKILGGYEWQSPLCAWGTGWNQIVRAESFDWHHERGDGDDWQLPHVGVHGARHGSQQEVEAHHRLRPAVLPPMLDEPRRAGQVVYVGPWNDRPVASKPLSRADMLSDEVTGWQKLLGEEASLTLAPQTRRRVVIDMGDYVCARPRFVTSGGRSARVDIHWTEGLYEDTIRWSKGHRDEWQGKYFAAHGQRQGDELVDGPGDTFWLDGEAERTFSTLWWQAGRFIQVLIETGDAPLTLQAFDLRETRYPLEMQSAFSSSDARLQELLPMMVRGLQMCAHETYMDCPFFEQLMYVGDTRLEILATYVLTRDDRLPKKALQLFDWSRLQNGLTQSRYPSSTRQIIPPFSLWWVAMVHDFALWRDDAAFVRSLLPGVRAVCDYFATLIGEDSLMRAPDGWNFTDWVRTTSEEQQFYGDDPNWRHGISPTASWETSGVLNWHAALTFRLAGELESWFGAPQLAELQQQRATDLARATDAAFWNPERKLYADDLAHKHWSEHAQCLALLSGVMPAHKREDVGQGLLETPDLARTTIYFSFYLFEAFRLLERPEAFFARLDTWNELAQHGLKTTIELPEPTRSDCHGWGAHPLFHCFATLAGIRPTAPGFTQVEIRPQPGPLPWLSATLPHPKGTIRVQLQDSKIEVELPDGVTRSR
jgi:alpha-L-rhamnosidase